MKKLVSLLLALVLLLLLAACASKSAEPSSEPLPTVAPTAAPTPSPTPLPPFVPEGEAQMAELFSRLDDGTLYCADTPLEDYIYLPEWLSPAPEDGSMPYIPGLLVAEGRLYFISKTNFLDRAPSSICSADGESGEYCVLAVDGSMGTRLAMVDGQLLYTRDDGLRAIDPANGAQSAFLEGRYVLHAAYGGWVFYSREDGTLCRNNAALSAEAELLTGETVKYVCADASTVAVMTIDGDSSSLRLLDWHGQEKNTMDFAGSNIEMFVHDGEIYLHNGDAMTLEVRSLSDLSHLRSIAIDSELVYFSILHIDRDGVLFQCRREQDLMSYWRMDPNGENAVELDTLAF